MKTKIFESLGNVVNGFFDKRTKEELFFSQKFNNFFILEDYLFCAKMIDEGYVATSKEKAQLNKVIVQKLNKNEYQYKDIRFFKNLYESTKLEGLLKAIPVLELSYRYSNHSDAENYSVINTMINANHKLENEDFLLEELKHDKNVVFSLTKEFIAHYKVFYKRGVDMHGDFCLQPENSVKQTNVKLERIIYLNILMMKNNCYLPEEINQLKADFKKINAFFERKTSKTYREGSFYRCKKGLWQNFSEALIHYSHKEDTNNKEELIRQLNSYSNRKKSLNEEIKELINKEDYNVSNLPKEAKEKIENIETIAQKINTEETKHFIQSRLPLILKKYFSIDEQYRTELKNVEGYNATELMIQSLDNIERLLIAKQQDDNYDLLSELSVENRKLKMHKVV